MTAPASPRSLAPDLVAQIAGHATRRSDQVALRFLRRGEEVEDEVTYAGLHRSAQVVACNLKAAGLVGRPVLVALPQGLDFVRCFLGCLYAGAIAVPTPALGDPRGAERILRIVEHAQPAALIAPGDRYNPDAWATLRTLSPALDFVAAHDLVSGEPGETPPQRPADDIAFLQYTSGSTTNPKGVVVTGGNVSANLAMIQSAFAQDATNSTVSWLPLHHDMGLLGCVLEPLSIGATAILMSPLSFLQKPVRWLRAMDRFEATTAGAPNFAYDLCVRAIDRDQARTLDLSRWSLAFCGSEPVRAGTLTRFADRFAASGFPAGAFYPCYGLAEATLFVTGGDRGSGVQTASLPRQGGGAITAVCCGYPRNGTAISVVEPEGTRRLPADAIGEICVAGEQVSPGFWQADGSVRPDPGRELEIDGRRYLRTGDLGTVRDGSLYVVGRCKNMIIVRGMNIYAEDVEQTVLRQPGAASWGAVAALGVLDGRGTEEGDEGLIIVCELARGGELPAPDPLPALAEAISETHGILPLDIFVVPHGAITRTVSGKLQRDATRLRLKNRDLSVLRHFQPIRIGRTPIHRLPSDNPHTRGTS
ncbi:fatty acyl-AMP ligase [Microbaculum marinum]|uniref:Fatty acyl-AMP ligase n=1 Tax=Microbaculum marinum TaxID=1764581 RepID=A0AAW9RTJ8_9HYPH